MMIGIAAKPVNGSVVPVFSVATTWFGALAALGAVSSCSPCVPELGDVDVFVGVVSTVPAPPRDGGRRVRAR